jgi:hypothetical protein
MAVAAMYDADLFQESQVLSKTPIFSSIPLTFLLSLIKTPIISYRIILNLLF